MKQFTPPMHTLRPMLCLAFFAGVFHAAEVPNGALPEAKLDQWLTELRGGKLSDEAIQSIASLALSAQANATLEWDSRWGEFVEFAHKQGKLADTMWRDYLLGCVQVHMSIAAQARRSPGLEVWFYSDAPRLGDHSGIRAVCSREDDLSGIAIPRDKMTAIRLMPGNGNGNGWKIDLSGDHYATLTPGPQTYHYRYRISVFDDAVDREKPVGERVIEETLPWLLVGDGEAWPLPALKPDATLKSLIEKVLGKSSSKLYLLRDTKDKTLIEVHIQIDDPPADMAFDVSLRSGDRSWQVGPMAWKKGDMQGWAHNVDLPVEVTHVDLVFTPSARAGMWASHYPTYPLLGLTSIWSGEPITTPNVKIRSQDISMIKQSPPEEEEAREHLMDALKPDSELARQLAEGVAFKVLQERLEEQTLQPNPRPEAMFALGCVSVAQGQLDKAMATLLKVGEVAGLEERLQRELRYICSRWLHAADQGSVPEMFSLGIAYEAGNGVGQDAQMAKYWYRKAANAGHTESKVRLAAMKSLAPSATGPAEQTLAAYRDQAAKWHEKPTESYQEWVGKHQRKELRSRDFQRNLVALKVVMTMVEGEGEKAQEYTLGSPEIKHGTELLMNGQTRSFYHSSSSSKGGGGDMPLPADKLARIDQLIAQLPDDHELLPLPNRRLLIELASVMGHQSLVFDRANAPAVVYELMRLLGDGSAYVPQFQAASSIDVRGFDHDGALAVSPQHEILFTGRGRRLQWWDAASHEFLAESDVQDVRGIVFSPDKAHALVQASSDTVLIDLLGRKPLRTFKSRFGAQFTQDGRRVLLYAGKAPMLTLDAESWEPVDSPEDLPIDHTKFIPAPSVRRAVVRAADGTVALWDTGKNRPIRELCLKSDAKMFATFSPDESLIALCIQTWQGRTHEGTPLVICNADTGEEVHNLRPFETGGNREIFQSLLWTPDSDYVLAATGSSSGASSISVFNAATGKHRGELIGPIRINGMGLLTKSHELVAGDQHGKIWFWDLAAVIDRIREFEATLAQVQK